MRKVSFSDVHRSYKRLIKRLPDVLHLKNIVLFSGVATILIIIMFGQRFNALQSYLPTEPIKGGVYKEGVVGQMKQFNPLYSPRSSAETTVVSLVFSGLIKNIDNYKVESDLAESWSISKDNKKYTFHLKDNVFWHDGEKLTADDVVFTFETIQNPDVASPRLSTWKGVKVKSPDERTVVFELPSPYAPFIYLCDVPIIPKHILKDISPENLLTSEFSLSPVGSGPFVFEEYKKVKDSQEVHLKANEKFYGQQPYFEGVIVKSYPNYNDLIHAYNLKDVYGVEEMLPSDLNNKDILPTINSYNLSIPEYDVLFFNLGSESLKDVNLRKAITYAIDKKSIVESVFDNYAIPVNGPILPGFLGYNKKVKQIYDVAKAKKILKDGGYELKGNNLTKDGKKISLRLLVESDPLKHKEAQKIVEMLKDIGVEVIVEDHPFSIFVEEYVRPRNYDLLIIGQNIGPESDLYAFYHSDMKSDPGLNFSKLSSREVDKYLEEARTSSDKKFRDKRYQEASEIITNNYVAVYLCWPDYIYGVSKIVKGVEGMRLLDPKDRFWNISNWYIEEKTNY